MQMKVINILYFAATVQSISSSSIEVINRRTMQKISKDIPFYPDPVYRPPPKPVKIPMSEVTGTMDVNTETQYWFQRELTIPRVCNIRNIPKARQIIFSRTSRIGKSYQCRLVQKFLPKQADIDKMLKVIERKVLKGTHLPLTIKEIQVGYLVSCYFKNIFLYLAQNRLPSTKTAIGKVETLAEKYIILDSSLCKIVTTPEKEIALLAIPEVCTDKDHYTLSFKFICGTSRSNKNISYNEW